MKTYAEQRAQVRELIKNNPALNEVELKEVIAEDPSRILVRVVGAIKIAGEWWPTWNHELWIDKEKYKAGITSECVDHNQHIYMTNIAGSDEKTLIEYFNRVPACTTNVR